MNIDLLRQQQRWKDGLQELRTGLASVAAQVRGLQFCLWESGCMAWGQLHTELKISLGTSSKYRIL